MALLLATSAAIQVGGAPLTVTAAPACVDGWQKMAIQSTLARATPFGSASLGGQPAWWVGKQSYGSPAIAHWSAGVWRNVATPWQADGGLNAVAATSSSSAWAVGYKEPGKPRPISARWNGNSWIAINVPHLGGRMATLTDVVAMGPDSAVAVGSRLVTAMMPLAYRFAAGSWTSISPTLGATEQGGLTAAASSADGRIWAVGWRSSNGTPRPWITYLDQSGWHTSTAATVSDGVAILTDVAFRSATEGWAVGYRERTTGGGYDPLVQRWDGVSWQNQSVSWLASSSTIVDTVAVNASGQVALGGSRIGNNGPSATLGRGQPNDWLVTAERPSGWPGSWVADSSALATGAFAVGRGATSEAFRSCTGATAGAVGDQPAPVAPRPPVTDESPDAADAPSDGPAGPVPAALEPVPLVGYVALDMTASAGLQMKAGSYSGVVADFNNDTWPDVYINRHVSDIPLLMLGGPTGFTNANAPFPFMDRHGCAAGQVDTDPHLDLFCSVGRSRGSTLATQELRLNVGGSGGTAAAADFGVVDASGRGRAAVFVKLTQDPFPALLVLNKPDRVDGLPSFNRLFRNTDGTHFTPAPQYGLDSPLNPNCATAANIDADADDEVLICASASGGVPSGARLYDFDGSTFRDRTAELGITPIGDQDIEVADFNGDGLPDLAQLSANLLRVSLRGVSGFHNVFELSVPHSLAMATGDVNEDGRSDIYISRSGGSNKRHLMLVNGGNGTSFQSVVIPQAGTGSPDDVLAIDYDKNGLTDFVTLNGRYTDGPVKLISFFRTN